MLIDSVEVIEQMIKEKFVYLFICLFIDSENYLVEIQN